MRSPRWCTVGFALLLMVLGSSRHASAQTDEEFFQTFPFNFSNPGARSSAMGGAFIGVADDATAAVTNPAGLTKLTRRQVYVEYKNLYAPVGELPFTDSLRTEIGRLAATPRASLPGFVNFAMPVNDKVTVAFSEHQFLSYQSTFNLDPRQTISIADRFVFPRVAANVDFTGFSYSGAAAIALTPQFRIGAAASINHLSASVDATRTITTSSQAKLPSTAIHDGSTAAGATVGLLYQPADRFSVGLMYAYEPRFTVQEGVVGTPPVGSGFAASDSWQVPINTPSRTGVGLGWRPTSQMLVAFDADWVQYSSLVQNQQLVLYRHFNDSFSNLLNVAGVTAPNPAEFRIKDGLDIHGGVETTLLNIKGRNPVLFRYGISRTAPHSVTYGSHPSTNFNDYPSGLVDQVYWAQTSAVLATEIDTSNPASPTIKKAVALRSAEIGFSFGGGIVIGPRTQIDFAYVKTNYQRQEFIVSSAVRF